MPSALLWAAAAACYVLAGVAAFAWLDDDKRLEGRIRTSFDDSPFWENVVVMALWPIVSLALWLRWRK